MELSKEAKDVLAKKYADRLSEHIREENMETIKLARAYHKVKGFKTPEEVIDFFEQMNV